MAKTLVFPGDAVAIAEEFQAGPGTYEESGQVYAARIGELELDPSEFIARVRPVTKFPITLQPGDIVLGTVRGIRNSMAMINVHRHADHPTRDIAGDTNGTLHVAKVMDGYVDRMEDVIHLGDIIRAEVVETRPSLQLSTKGPGFGVLRSYCPRCRNTMEAKGNGLVCPECEWKETAKTARDYGRGTLIEVSSS